ncbi:hypothetical protein ON010_g18852 [Phytophthora cinnamomi]|nr:hypothetical protein ON010_g18852 [Phytophthora cinnamomi]
MPATRYKCARGWSSPRHDLDLCWRWTSSPHLGGRRSVPWSGRTTAARPSDSLGAQYYVEGKSARRRGWPDPRNGEWMQILTLHGGQGVLVRDVQQLVALGHGYTRSNAVDELVHTRIKSRRDHGGADRPCTTEGGVAHERLETGTRSSEHGGGRSDVVVGQVGVGGEHDCVQRGAVDVGDVLDVAVDDSHAFVKAASIVQRL